MVVINNGRYEESFCIPSNLQPPTLPPLAIRPRCRSMRVWKLRLRMRSRVCGRLRSLAIYIHSRHAIRGTDVVRKPAFIHVQIQVVYSYCFFQNFSCTKCNKTLDKIRTGWGPWKEKYTQNKMHVLLTSHAELPRQMCRPQ